MNPLAYKFKYQRNLPHIQPPGATLFVTFRLTGSIPLAIQQELIEETERIEQLLQNIANLQVRAERAYLEKRRMFGQWDHVLDTTKEGPHWLKNPQIAQIVSKSIRYRDEKVYDLDTFCIMSNHAHVLFTPLEKEDGSYHAVSAIMQSLKRYTARKSNLILRREGQFWQYESYDHFVRNDKELQRIRQYILNNPVKAGLVQSWDEWPWTYCKYL